MKKHKKIAWQKYEDVIETQLNSPIANSLISSFLGTNEPIDLPSVEDEEDRIIQDQFMVSIPESLSNEIYLITNFDCWIGHTNFDITETIKKQMNKIEGIEVLKICSKIGRAHV